jgi:hypothetical protein
MLIRKGVAQRLLSVRVVLFSSICLIFAARAFPQCNYHLLYSGEYRASIFDISIDGNDLWTASGYGVQLYDRSVNPPRLSGSVGIPGLTRLVRASHGVAYAGGPNGISVVRRNGRVLQLVRTIATTPVNDLLLTTTTLFAATTTGVVAFDLVDPLNPTRTSATFHTSVTTATSLALNGSFLLVADGDSTVESFSIVVPASPQPGPTITSLARSTTIETISSRVYVSDGFTTQVFSATGSSYISAGSLPFAATSIADAGANVVVVAGADRQFRAVDASVPANYAELFEGEIIPTGGTVNRVTSLQIAGGRLYVGGGDTGLATYDIAPFASPFPLRAYGIGGTTSVVVLANAMYAGRATTGIQEMNRSVSGSLVLARQWSPQPEVVQDGATGFLLSSTGPLLKYWTLNSTIPQLITSATFRSAVSNAFLSGSTAIALLADGTLWTADMAASTPVPVRVASGPGTFVQLARSDRGTAATEVSAEGATTIHYWGGDLNAAPVNTAVAGASTALALDGTTAAVFTFRGITVVDVSSSSSTQSLLPSSNASIVKALQSANGKVLALTEESVVRIWDMATVRLEKEILVPGSATALDAVKDSAVTGVATAAGIAQINYGTSSSLPLLVARTGGNSYYRKAAASTNRLYLFDGRIVDIYELTSTAAPHWLASVFVPGTIDIAASDSMLFVLSNSGVVTEFSSAGAQLRSATLNEGIDAVPLGISSVAGAPWVSFSRGCTTSNCEKRTSVLDPQSLVRTASIAGGVVDVAATGTRAYALFDLPAEVRVYSTADPLHPSSLTSRATDVAAVSIAYDSGTVYLLADRAYAYSESSLTRTGEQLTALTPATGADIVIDNGCATISGRSLFAQTYALPQWNAGADQPAPGAIRTMTAAGGRLIILTDYSIEVRSRAAAPKPSRRRSVGGQAILPVAPGSAKRTPGPGATLAARRTRSSYPHRA